MAITYSAHALKRMFERERMPVMVEQAVQQGQVIQAYPDDQPYPSRLILGWAGSVPLHVLVAQIENGDTVVITAYVPDPTLWDVSFTRRCQ